MGKILWLVLVIAFISIIGLLCFFSCVLASKKGELWEKIKFEDKHDE